MSDEALRWAIGLPVGSPEARDVLLALADRHRPGEPLYVSMSILAHATELRPVPLYIALRRLLAAGLIRTVGISEFMTIELALSSEVTGADERENVV